MAQAAWATEGAHFFSATSSIDNNGALVVNFDEAGVGQQLVNYTLNADSTVIYACINGGGNHPKASNKETVSGGVSGQTTARPKNGRVVSSLSAGPLSAGSFSCPSGQTLVLAKVTYSGITLTDTTNGVSTGGYSGSDLPVVLRPVPLSMSSEGFREGVGPSGLTPSRFPAPSVRSVPGQSRVPRVLSSRAPGTRYLGRDDGGGAPVASAGSDSRPSLSPIAPGATYEAGLAHVEYGLPLPPRSTSAFLVSHLDSQGADVTSHPVPALKDSRLVLALPESAGGS